MINGGMANWAMTTLESPPSSSLDPTKTGDGDSIVSIDPIKEVSIDPFTTNLLATNFPYPPKYQTENELSGAASLHVAAHLQSAIDAPLLHLGLHCTKDAEQLGSELRWVLACEGVAAFDMTGRAVPTWSGIVGSPDVNAAVGQAFVGQGQNDFLERLYPRYEMHREKTGWDVERARRSRKRKGVKEKKKKTQNNEKKKKSQKKKKKRKKKKKSRKNKKQQMKPNSDVGSRPQSNEGGLNVMGYVAGSKGKEGASKPASGVQVVIVDDDTRKTSRSRKNKKQQMKPNSDVGSRPQSNEGGLNVMGYVTGSQGEGGARDMASSVQVIVVDDDTRKRRRNK